jgi:DNA primase
LSFDETVEKMLKKMESSSLVDNYLLEHDHYSNIRKQNVQKQESVKKEKERVKREKVNESLFAWKKEGRSTFVNLQREALRLNLLLEQHKRLKQCMSLLLDLPRHPALREKKPSFSLLRSRRLSSRMLSTLKQNQRKFTHPTKTDLIFKRVILHKELQRKHNDSLVPWQRSFSSSVTDLALFRRLMRYYASCVHIEKSEMLELKKKRYIFSQATKKMNLIKSTQAACARIPFCKKFLVFPLLSLYSSLLPSSRHVLRLFVSVLFPSFRSLFRFSYLFFLYFFLVSRFR